MVGFPLLFETQPRPIPIDIAIEIPKKEGAPSLPLPPPRTASAVAATARVSSGVVGERSAEPPREPAAPAIRSEPAPSGDAVRKEPTAPRSEATPPPKPAPAKPESRADDGARARALLEGQSPAPASSPATPRPGVVAAAEPSKPTAATSVEAAKADAAGGRFVVQVGAYGEANSARDMRQRVDKLGLKSYTQVVEIDGAKRIRVRVGPFAAREDAEKAAGTLKAAGLPAAVMTL